VVRRKVRCANRRREPLERGVRPRQKTSGSRQDAAILGSCPQRHSRRSRTPALTASALSRLTSVSDAYASAMRNGNPKESVPSIRAKLTSSGTCESGEPKNRNLVTQAKSPVCNAKSEVYLLFQSRRAYVSPPDSGLPSRRGPNSMSGNRVLSVAISVRGPVLMEDTISALAFAVIIPSFSA